MRILVLNCGGSSIKFGLYEMPSEKLLGEGAVERLGTGQAVAKWRTDEGTRYEELGGVKDHAGALSWVIGLLQEVLQDQPLAAVGHRVVHGGDRITGSVLVTKEVVEVLRECSKIAPLHNPPAIMGIEACSRLVPEVPQVAVFDNAFHKDLPPASFLYGLPYELYERYGFRRYGFHGLAFESMTEQACAMLGRSREELRIVSLMLGSGTTANALLYGRSFDVSTGYTPCEGLLQSTRCGDLDPALLVHLMREFGWSTEQMDDLIYKKSGWLGISGVSADMAAVEAAAAQGHERAQLALEVFVHRARKYVGAYAAAMGGMDLLVFGGGVGENSPYLRARICENLVFLGVELDPAANAALKGAGIISKPSSRVAVVVAKVDEDLVLARETAKVLRQIGRA